MEDDTGMTDEEIIREQKIGIILVILLLLFLSLLGGAYYNSTSNPLICNAQRNALRIFKVLKQNLEIFEIHSKSESKL